MSHFIFSISIPLFFILLFFVDYFRTHTEEGLEICNKIQKEIRICKRVIKKLILITIIRIARKF
jgi:hypothetical protein